MRDFVGEYKATYPLLDVEHPVTYGALDLQDYFMEHKRAQAEAMKNSRKVILDVAREYKRYLAGALNILRSIIWMMQRLQLLY